MKSKGRFMLLALAFLAMAFAGCGVAAHVEKDETVNFQKYKTYSWVTGKSVKDRNSNDIIDGQIKRAAAKELQKAGWREVRSGADVLLDYNIMVENNVKTRS